MSSLLFVTWDGGGNVPPALGVAVELRRRGHAVRFLGHGVQRDAIQAAGFAFATAESARPWSSRARHSGPTAPLDYAQVFADRGIGEDLTALATHWGVDRVVIDGLLIGTMDVAAKAGIPYVPLVHTFYAVFDRVLNGGRLGVQLREWGLDPQEAYAAADSVLVTALRELDPAGNTALAGGIRYTGPVLPATALPDQESRPDSPRVLVSLSTTYIDGQQEALQAILDATAPLPVSVVVTTGPAVDPATLHGSGNSVLRQFVPHSEVMPQASLVIGHAGHATTMQALAHGLPLLLMPMSPYFDQPAIAEAVSGAGAGRMLPKDADPADIRSAVQDLLASDSARAAATRLGTAIQRVPGAIAAADTLTAPIPDPVAQP
jgi:UDP:flavonoid glycosyltransferase YjiC (YdhE family)